MAESVAFTYDGDPDSPASAQRVRRIIVAWTSAADGTATGTSKKISGHLLKVTTDPGTAAPTASYDIVLTDDYAANILAKAADDLADRHTSTTETVELMLLDYAGTPLAVSLRPVVCSPITVDVSNAGDAKDGTIVIYWMPG